MPDPIMHARPHEANGGGRLTAKQMDDEFEARYNAIALGGKTLSGLLADMPVASPANAGVLYLATDQGMAHRSDGANWSPAFYLVATDTWGAFGGNPIARPTWIADATGVGDIVAQFNALKNDVCVALNLMAGPG